MSVLYLIDGALPIEPKPNSRRNADVADFGSYGSSYNMHRSNDGNNQSRILGAYGFGADNNTHYSEPLSWISLPLQAGTFNGTWSANINFKATAAPSWGFTYTKAQLWVWNADDTQQEVIGAAASNFTALDGTFQELSFNFGSDNVTIQDGDRIYLEVWLEVHDDTTNPGEIITTRVWFNSATYDSYITCPGTQENYYPKHLMHLAN